MNEKNSLKKEIGNRLKLLRKKLGLSREEFAKMLNVNPSTLNNYMVGNRELSPLLAVKLKEKFNVNLNWLFAGELPIFNDKLIIEETDTDEIVKLPFFKENFVSAGYGFSNVKNPPVLVSFSKDLLKTIADVPIDRGIHLVFVFGNSMEPTIPERAIAIVSDFRVEGFLREGSIYVVRYDGEEFIKRIFRDPINKTLKLISDNPDYPPIEVPREESDRFQILGRVIGYLARV